MSVEKQAQELAVDCTKEVVEWHHVFEDWFGGALTRTLPHFERFTAVQRAEFRIVAPDGRTTAREPLAARLWQAHGSRPGRRVWVRKPFELRLSKELVPVTYEVHETWRQATDLAAEKT